MNRYVEIANEHKRFGKLTLQKYVGKINVGKSNLHAFECKCDCGNTKIVPYAYLMQGTTKTCGKCKQQNWIGKEFGLLKVQSIAQKSYYDTNGKYHPLKLQCRCTCGNTTIVFASTLASGHTSSCGCLKSKRRNKSVKFTEEEKEVMLFVAKHKEVFNNRMKLNRLLKQVDKM